MNSTSETSVHSCSDSTSSRFGDQSSSFDVSMHFEAVALRREIYHLTRQRNQLLYQRSRQGSRFWRDITSHQRKLREEAERNRESLRAAVRIQREEASRIMEVERNFRHLGKDRAVDAQELRVETDTLAFMMDTMLDRLDRAAVEWRETFAQSRRLANYRWRFHDWEFLDIDDNLCTGPHPVITSSSSMMFRFSARGVLEAMWDFLSGSGFQNDNFSQIMKGARKSNCMLDSRIAISTSFLGTKGKVEARALSRRFITPDDDLVIATVSCGKLTLQGSDGKIAEALICEDSWLRVIKVFDDRSANALPPLTIVQEIRRMRIKRADSDRFPVPKIQTARKILGTVITSQHRLIHRQVEQALVQSTPHWNARTVS